MTDENNIINKIYAGIEAAHANKSDTTEDSSTPPGRIAELETELKAIIQMYEAKEKHNLWLAIQLSEASEHIAELDAIIAKLKTAYERKEEHHTAAIRRVEELTKQLKYANQAIAHHMAANQQLGPALDTARKQVTRLTKQLEAKEIEIE